MEKWRRKYIIMSISIYCLFILELLNIEFFWVTNVWILLYFIGILIYLNISSQLSLDNLIILKKSKYLKVFLIISLILFCIIFVRDIIFKDYIINKLSKLPIIMLFLYFLYKIIPYYRVNYFYYRVLKAENNNNFEKNLYDLCKIKKYLQEYYYSFLKGCILIKHNENS